MDVLGEAGGEGLHDDDLHITLHHALSDGRVNDGGGRRARARAARRAGGSVLVVANTVPMVSAAISFPAAMAELTMKSLSALIGSVSPSISIVALVFSSLILIVGVAEPPVVKNSETSLSTVRN